MTLATAVIASAQAPSRDPAASTACSYLTKEDAAAALGEAVAGPKGNAVPVTEGVELRIHGIFDRVKPY